MFTLCGVLHGWACFYLIFGEGAHGGGDRAVDVEPSGQECLEQLRSLGDIDLESARVVWSSVKYWFQRYQYGVNKHNLGSM